MTSTDPPVLSGIFEGYPQDLDFNLAALSPILGDLHMVLSQQVPMNDRMLNTNCGRCSYRQ